MPKVKEELEAIDLREKVEVIATKDAPHHAEGEVIRCHPKMAEHFIAIGVATTKGAKAGKEKKAATE
jgi:hypothetical protein